MTDRARLFDLLDRARQRPIIFISAPPGAGKTTLAWSYLQARDIRCLWYQVDITDLDVASFFHHLQLAAERVVGPKASELELKPRDWNSSTEALSRRTFRKLCQLAPGAALVFDNLQEVPPDSELFRVLSIGLSELPLDRAALLLSREALPPPFARLHAERRIQQLDGLELRFEPEEVQTFCQQYAATHDVEISTGVQAALVERSDGWAAGLVLLVEAVRRAGEAAIISSGRELVFDYFATEVLDSISPATQQVLLKTAMLEEIPSALAAEISGHSDAPDRLRDLSRRGFFTVFSGRETEVWQYHPLFRDFLRNRAARQMGSASWRDLSIQAAQVLQSHGYHEQAIELLVQHKAWEILSHLLLPLMPGLLGKGRHRSIQRWIGAVPPEELTDAPWLRYASGLALIHSNPASARRELELAFDRFEREGDLQGCLLSWTSLVQATLVEQHDFAILEHRFEQGQTLLSKCSPEDRRSRAQVYAGMVSCLIYGPFGMPRQRERVFDDALRLLPDLADPTLRPMLLFFLHSTYAYAGMARERLYVLELLASVAEEPDASPVARTARHTAEAYEHWISGRYDASARACARALDCVEDSGVNLLEMLARASRACCALNQEDLETADEQLRLIRESITPAQRWYYAFWRFLVGWREVVSKNWEEARVELDLAFQTVHRLGAEVFKVHPYSLLALTHHHLGNARARDEVLTRLREHAEAGGRWSAYSRLFVEAEIALLEGDRARAMDRFGQALELGEEARFACFHGFRATAAARLCAEALKSESVHPQVYKLIDKHRLVPPIEESLVDERWPWRVKLWMLGRFEVELSGKGLAFRGKRPQRPLELLQLLVVRGGDGVPEQWLEDTLWPQAEGKATAQSLATTLHRVRRLLGNDQVLRRQDGIITLDRTRVWADVWHVRELLSMVGSGIPSPEMVERLDRVYRGLLLPTSTLPPILGEREQLRVQVARVFRRAGDEHLQNRQWDAAVAAYESCLRVNSTQENVYCSLMRAFLAQGLSSEGLSAFERCRLMLEHEWGEEPSAETKALYHELRRS